MSHSYKSLMESTKLDFFNELRKKFAEYYDELLTNMAEDVGGIEAVRNFIQKKELNLMSPTNIIIKSVMAMGKENMYDVFDKVDDTYIAHAISHMAGYKELACTFERDSLYIDMLEALPYKSMLDHTLNDCVRIVEENYMTKIQKIDFIEYSMVLDKMEYGKSI